MDLRRVVDRGVSGSKDRRPALDQLLTDARRRKFDVEVCWRLDRLGRNLRHLVTLIDELQSLGVAFVSLGEGIDCTTPAASCSCTSSRPWRSSSGLGFRSGSGRD
jgi:DNA invertase Pin-like site-specific DNA recombinase